MIWVRQPWSFSALLLLTACNQGFEGNKALKDAEDRDARDHPVGRYQMVSTGDGVVVVLDTMRGGIAKCVAVPDGMDCKAVNPSQLGAGS